VKEPITQGSIPLQCICNGARRVLELKKVVTLFWQVHCAWLLPLDWYRFQIEDCSHTAYVSRTMQERPRFMLLLLHRRGHLALRLDELIELDPLTAHISGPTFTSRASRINKTMFAELPEPLRPVEFFSAYDETLDPKRAYRIRPGCDTLLVIGTERTSGFKNDDVDWTVFLTPPEE